MSLNLNMYGLEMQAAWKEVMDAGSDTDWALYGYNPNTFDLKLVAKGDRGIEEMVQELNPSQIMYAFIRVHCPETNNAEFVFLHWQGESCPAARKGRAATHLRDVERYFAGHHVTVTARCEDDIDAEDITDKAVAVSKSKFDFRDKCAAAAETEAPAAAAVGSAHRRIIPQNELPKMSERERFWLEEENKEKARKEDERQRKVTENRKIDEARRQKEEADTAAREAKIRERERKISQLKPSPDQDDAKRRLEREEWDRQQREDLEEEKARQRRGDDMKRKRSEEARKLIQRQKSQEARAVFEQHTAYGQMSSLQQAENAVNANEIEDVVVVPPPASFGNNDNHRAAAAAAVAVEASEPPPPPPPDVTHNASQPDLIQDVTKKSDPDVTKQSTAEYGICAVALYDYAAADETEISFDPGQVITHIDKIDPGWWQGLSPGGTYGLFPSNYVELIDPKDLVVDQ